MCSENTAEGEREKSEDKDSLHVSQKTKSAHGAD